MDEETVIILLESRLDEIRARLGRQWRNFAHDLHPLQESLENVDSSEELAQVVNRLFQICLGYDAVKQVFREALQEGTYEIRRPNPQPQKRAELHGLAQRYISFIADCQAGKTAGKKKRHRSARKPA